MLIFSIPKSNPHFEQPPKITICQIHPPKSNTNTLIEIFRVPPPGGLKYDWEEVPEQRFQAREVFFC